VSSVRERTQKEIIDYIRTHSKDGKLTKSLLDIGKDMGYSNATIHRALHALEDNGVIEIAQSNKPTEPNTILYKGSHNDVDELLAKGVQLSEDVENLGNRVNDFLSEATWLFRKLQKTSEDSLEDRIIHVQDIPDSEVQILTVRKSLQ
jgi:DNA-binding PadR family transcriptional regulator